MCSDENCRCMDTCCCSLKTKSLFSCIWHLVHCVIVLIMGAVDLTAALQITQYSPVGAINNSSSLNYIHALDICSIVCGAIGIISGLMQLIGHYWLIGWVYIIGLGISSLVCFISYGFIFIYAFIVQIFCIIWCTRYYITEAE